MTADPSLDPSASLPGLTADQIRPATVREIKALANPLRLRILRLCLDEALTNQELAARLDRDPGTVLFHVRVLVKEGFLAPEPDRPGPRGRTERPYRSTRKSWNIRLPKSTDHASATIEAVRQEMLEAGQDAVLSTIRLGMRLRPDDLDELRKRLSAIADEFADRGHDDGEPVALLIALHRRKVRADGELAHEPDVEDDTDEPGEG